MNRYGRKAGILSALTLMSFTTALSAANDMQMRNLENRVSTLEQLPASSGMINPPARPIVRDGTNLWIQADALFMHAQEDGLYYAVLERKADGGGRIKNARYEWNWGFRLGAGYNIPHDGWDMLLNWTWFRTHGHRRTPNRDGFLVKESLSNIASANYEANLGTSATGNANLHFATLDYELGREFFVSKWATLRPFVGGRGGWFKRGLRWTHTCSQCLTHDFGRHTTKFSGGGLRGGLNTQWAFGMGWSVFADMALNLLYGTERLHQPGTHKDLETNRLSYEEKTHDNWIINRPMLDLAFGLRWDQLIFNDVYRIRFQLGWEQHILWGFAKSINYVTKDQQGKYTFNNGDLTLSGFAFQGRFDF